VYRLAASLRGEPMSPIRWDCVDVRHAFWEPESKQTEDPVISRASTVIDKGLFAFLFP